MEYAIHYIIRFEGTLTQGPNKGKAYTFANSWGGGLLNTSVEAFDRLAEYRRLEPQLKYKVCSRQWQGGKKGKFVEVEIYSD